MTTPNGGDYSTAVAMLCGVQIDNIEEADYIEITEWMNDGTVVARTYSGDIAEGLTDRSSLSAVEQGQDNDPELSDQIKLTWDIRGPDFKPVQSLGALLVALGLNWDLKGREAIANMTVLPVWVTAPQQIKDEVDNWLSE